ncbi:Wzy polymerase domain-containing protein [Pseudescherichia vulneris]
MNVHPFYGRTLVALCGLYLLVLMHIYQPNMGGIGLSLPINILGWCVISAIICAALVLSFSQRMIVVSRSLVLFAFAACLLCIPLFYPEVRWVNAIGRMAGLFGGIVFYATLQQQHLMKKNSGLLLVIILISAGIEALYALLQIFVFEAENWMEFRPGQRAYGIFQQVNVLSSYLATGLGIAVYLLYQTDNSARTSSVVKGGNAALLVGISLLSFVIVLISSRIGYLGGGVAVLLLIGCYSKQHPRRTLLIIVAILAGGVAAKFGLPGSWLESIAHEGSNRQRMMILHQSALMIAEKPWLGWGYGSFGYHFQHFVGAKQPLVINHEIVTHPHNEIIYWWVEGGIVALMGMVLIGIGYLLPVIKDFNRTRLALWGLTLPIMLHTMTEYPLYQSVPHLIVLVVLLVNVDSPCHCLKRQLSVKPWQKTGVLLITLLSFLFLVTGLQTNEVLTRLERSGLVDFVPAEKLINPYIQWKRYELDRHYNKLVMYKTVKEKYLLVDYSRWAENYSRTTVNVNVYLTRITVSNILSESIKAHEIYQELRLIAPAGYFQQVSTKKN